MSNNVYPNLFYPLTIRAKQSEEAHIVPLAKQPATRQSVRLRKKLVKGGAPLTSLTTELTQHCAVNRKGSQTSTSTYDGTPRPISLWFPKRSSIDTQDRSHAHFPFANVGQVASLTSYTDDLPALALPKYPPRPYAYEPLALKAFEDAPWDQAEFDNMELSAIGWLASIGHDVVRPIVDMSCTGMENIPGNVLVPVIMHRHVYAAYQLQMSSLRY